MRLITIIAQDTNSAPEYTIYSHSVPVLVGEKMVRMPVGVEVAVSDELAAACIAQYTCRVGYFVADDAAVSALPTSGIADGSYVLDMASQILKFLSGGTWV